MARGTVSKSEAAETKREIERRIIAAAKRQDDRTMSQTSDKTRLIAVALTMGWLAVGSVALYATIGRPDLAQTSSAPAPAALTLGGQSLLPAEPRASAPQPQGQLGDVNAMIANLAARLQDNPNDLAGWQMLGWSYLNTGNAAAAAAAYARAVELAPGNAELLSLWGEATVRADGGVIGGAAQDIFRRSLAADPGNPRARFFAGLLLDQQGDTNGALDAWLALLDDTPPDADWRAGLITRIREAAAATGRDIGNLAPPARQPRGPTAEDVAAAQDMTAQDRQAMIRGMVDGLAARLAADPGDPEGWVRLIRSYGVLEDGAAQAKALADARAAMADNPVGLVIVDNAALELGLE